MSPTCNHSVVDHANELHQRKYIPGQPNKPLEEIQSEQHQQEKPGEQRHLHYNPGRRKISILFNRYCCTTNKPSLKEKHA
jgi:hypothetical protein